MDAISVDDVCDAIAECILSMEPDERAEAEHIHFLFSRLESYITEFEQAAYLYAHLTATFQPPHLPVDAEGNFATQDWTLDQYRTRNLKILENYLARVVIPARDAVITVYHIEQTIIAIRGNTGRSQTILQRHDAVLSKEAWKKFQAYFERAARMRHAYAHAAEHMKTLAEWKQHAPDGAYTFFGLFNEILSTPVTGGNTYVSCYRRQHKSLAGN